MVPLRRLKEGRPPREGLSLRTPRPDELERRYLEASHSRRWREEERAGGQAAGGKRKPFTQEK